MSSVRDYSLQLGNCTFLIELIEFLNVILMLKNYAVELLKLNSQIRLKKKTDLLDGFCSHGKPEARRKKTRKTERKYELLTSFERQP